MIINRRRLMPSFIIYVIDRAYLALSVYSALFIKHKSLKKSSAFPEHQQSGKIQIQITSFMKLFKQSLVNSKYYLYLCSIKENKMDSRTVRTVDFPKTSRVPRTYMYAENSYIQFYCHPVTRHPRKDSIYISPIGD